ncbi:type II toxin-antitoxin system RelE/ParE family toxin [Soonwooa sp.]|uniref:type II toxin-antitoxin system RelE/ParE family toxin n=1 Tax=Soonwooa sp. TaxID=1938592 RepID=UPI00289F780A|nr:type II toxin-antitoxin system RelE/ParE family toxin [Soonwooa sp.]
MKNNFEVELLPEAQKFLNELDEKVRDKIYFNIRKSQITNDKEVFKKLNDTIWEFRTLYNSNSYRLFAFWDDYQNSMVLATHGILKKTQKTPKKEIEKATEIKKQYIQYKYGNKK